MSKVTLGLPLVVALWGCADVEFPRAPLETVGPPSARSEAARFTLGQALFFDKELSGPRDIACATCHISFVQISEPLPLPIGTGGAGVGFRRRRGDGAIIRRHTPSLTHRTESAALFWDGRVERGAFGAVQAPVPLPPGVTDPIEAAVLLPLLDPDEMRGHGDNELAAFEPDESLAIWAAIVQRLSEIDDYRTLFEEAFPGGREPMRIENAAAAMVHFMRTVWNVFDSRFDRGELDDFERRGQELFFGDAGCDRCHSGERFTDDRFYNVGVPPLLPAAGAPLDLGRAEVTLDPSDRFAFRTPPLRNVSLTGPWMHNGTFHDLAAALRYHLDPHPDRYDDSHLPETLRSLRPRDSTLTPQLLQNLADTRPLRALSGEDIEALVAFLGTLSSRVELFRTPTTGVPERVPSGLPVDSWPGGPHPFK